MFTDGACSGNPGPGGWGVFISTTSKNSDVLRICGGSVLTTNNRMELFAAIYGFEFLNVYFHSNKDILLRVITDSQYLKKGITEWLNAWKEKNWITSSKTKVKNKDLWERLDVCSNFFTVRWEWVKGHAGNYGNEVADELARQGLNDITMGRKNEFI